MVSFVLRIFAALPLLIFRHEFVSSQSIEDIAPINFGFGALKHSNGNKVVVGRLNTLHTVWEDGSLVKYATSTDGINWGIPQIVASGIPGAMPSISSDSDGTLTVVFVANSNSNGMGDIYYVNKPWGSPWSVPHHLINSPATQPDITARGGIVHVAWSTIERVQYKQFPKLTPPAVFTFGEEIEVTACAQTGFAYPSVALVRESCETIAKVAYIRYSDEISSTDPTCVSLQTEVGARVCKRDPVNPTWALDYDDIKTVINPSSGVAAISLSMNADYKSGNTIVGWSDTTNGFSRTSLAHGQGSNWNMIDLNTEENHIHVATKRNSNGSFRYAMVKKDGSWTDFSDPDAVFRTGTWVGNVANPTWLHLEQFVHAGWGIVVGRPQATFWAKCTSGQYDTVEAVTEIEGVCATYRLASHVTQGQTCPPPTPYPYEPCITLAYAYYIRSKSDGIVLDVGDIGSVTYISQERRYAFIKGNGRKGLDNVMIMWSKGKMSWLIDDVVSISDHRAEIEIVTGGQLDVQLKEMKKPDNKTDVCRKKFFSQVEKKQVDKGPDTRGK